MIVELAEPFACGLAVWIITWGFNRVYLMIKTFVA